jgi:predicted nucleotidyltransferase
MVLASEWRLRKAGGRLSGVSDVDSVIDALRKRLESDPRFSSVWVYGSVARGQARPQSDLDLAYLAVNLEASARVREERLQLMGRLAIAFSRDVQLVDLDAVDTSLRMQIFEHGRPVFDRDPERTHRLIERTLMEWFDWEHARKEHEAYLDLRFQVKRG